MHVYSCLFNQSLGRKLLINKYQLTSTAFMKAIEADESLKSADICFLYAIWFKCNNQLEAIANYEELEAVTKLSKRTLSDALKRLVDTGWIKYVKGCTKYSNVYQIQYSKLRDFSCVFLPKTQAEPSTYLNRRRTIPIVEVGFNDLDHPVLLEEGEDPSMLLRGQYFKYHDRNEVYRVVVRDYGRYYLNAKRLTDLERGIGDGTYPKTVWEKLPDGEVPY